MADRRAQLLEAIEADEKTQTGDAGEDADETAAGSEEVDASGAGDSSSSVVETNKEGTSADVSGVSDTAGRGKKSAGSDPSKSDDLSKLEKVPKKADASKRPQDDAAKAKAAEQTEKAAAEAGEAPRAWKVTTREHWAKLPKEVREEVQRRETEITQFIGQHGKAIQHKAQFDEIVAPFMPFIAAQQSTPMKAFYSLMTTAARLTTAPTPQAKAQVISEIMKNYGVGPAELDEVLSAQLQGKPLQQGGPADNGQPPAWAKPLFGFMQETQQARVAREQRVQQQAAQELEAFEKTKPFFNDLREDIGFLMTRAAEKGQLMTMEQAYEKARKMNPEVDKVLTQREAAAKQTAGQTAIEKARKAASSIKGAPGGGVVGNGAAKQGDKALDRRAQIRASIDSLTED